MGERRPFLVGERVRHFSGPYEYIICKIEGEMLTFERFEGFPSNKKYFTHVDPLREPVTKEQLKEMM